MAKEEIAETTEETPAKSGGGRKNLVVGGVLLGVMIAEGLVVFVLAKHFGPQPVAAEAGAITGLDPAEGEPATAEAEVELARFRAQNERARQIVVYDLVVFATVCKADEEKFRELVEQKNAAIQDRFSSVIRAADPQVLMEPDPATLRQQFQQELGEIIGEEDMVRNVLIPSIVSYREG